MKIKFLSIVLFFILCDVNVTSAQQVDRPTKGTTVVPDEDIYVHVNSALFFVGEYLYYSLYVLNKTSNKLSNLSKIAYVELISEEGNSIFKHQLVLKNGLSQSDQFIPTELASGNYKLLAYTKNMLSINSENFFQQDISIINPYRGNQETITKSSENADIKKSELEIYKKTNLKDFSITTDKQNYKPRSEVLLALTSTNSDELIGASYSISVRKKDEIKSATLKAAINYQEGSFREKTNKTKILPEIRGKLLQGKLVKKSENISFKNKKVTLSIPGEDYVFKVSDVAENGDFYFNIDKPHVQNKAIFQVIGDTENNFDIQLDTVSSIDLRKLQFSKFFITPAMEKTILERSIHNQIENAYYRVKPDTIKTQPLELAYYGNSFKTYILDEYTRFPTMKETMVEIVDNAWIATDSDGHSKFYVREPEGYGRTGNPLLLLVDGIYLQSEDYLANFKASKVKSISILRDRYYLGSQIFQGVMIVETKENDFFKYMNEPYITETDLLADQPIKNYFTQRYKKDNLIETKRIPDYRIQLLWQPILKLDSPSNTIKFYTSDITGEFEIKIEGFTANGTPVSGIQTFFVD